MAYHVLVVDDEESISHLVARYLKKRGHEVSIAATSAQALAAIEETHFALVILDLVLAEEDGLDLLVAIKSRHPDLAVVIWTGQGYEEELLQEARAKGADGYVSKTLPMDQLLMEVHRMLKYSKAV